MTASTSYPDLNGVLDEFVRSVRRVLGDDFCGAYLQGSFAVGDADEHSDVDFIVVIRDELRDEQVAALQAMHAQIYALESEWAQHLEGSYVPREILRRLDPTRAPLWFLDNGSTELVRDNHCNTAVVRWVLRERGVVLDGPCPKSLVEPVSPDELRAEARGGMDEYVGWAHEPQDRFKDEHGHGPDMSRWKQPYLILTFCRLLHTLEHGIVVSKREAGEWAAATFGLEWRDLIQRALDDRPDPWLRVHQPADPEIAARTLEFAAFAAARAATYGKSG